jgi:hypothetical protein
MSSIFIFIAIMMSVLLCVTMLSVFILIVVVLNIVLRIAMPESIYSAHQYTEYCILSVVC